MSYSVYIGASNLLEKLFSRDHVETVCGRLDFTMEPSTWSLPYDLRPEAAIWFKGLRSRWFIEWTQWIQFKDTGGQVILNEARLTLQFESKDDAALFHLFWMEPGDASVYDFLDPIPA